MLRGRTEAPREDAIRPQTRAPRDRAESRACVPASPQKGQASGRGRGGGRVLSGAGPQHSPLAKAEAPWGGHMSRGGTEGRESHTRAQHFPGRTGPQISERKTKHRPQTPSSEVSTGTANPKDREDVPRRPRAPGGE